MKTYIVELERIIFDEVDQAAYSEGLAFFCSADDPFHAEEQARNAYPTGKVLGTYLRKGTS